METNALPGYEVEFLPVERRLGDRRRNPPVERRGTGAPERRVRERRQPAQALRVVQ